MVVDGCSGEARQLIVEHAYAIHELADFLLAHRAVDFVIALEADFVRDIGIEVVERIDTDNLQHLLDILFSMREILEFHGLDVG